MKLKWTSQWYYIFCLVTHIKWTFCHTSYNMMITGACVTSSAASFHSPPLSCSAPPAPLPPARGRFRDTLPWTSGTGALPCENTTSVASFLKPWQLFTRMQSKINEWHESYAHRCMVVSERDACKSRWKPTDAGWAAGESSASRCLYIPQPARLSLWQLLRCVSVVSFWLVATHARTHARQDHPAEFLWIFSDFPLRGIPHSNMMMIRLVDLNHMLLQCTNKVQILQSI